VHEFIEIISQEESPRILSGFSWGNKPKTIYAHSAKIRSIDVRFKVSSQNSCALLSPTLQHLQVLL